MAAARTAELGFIAAWSDAQSPQDVKTARLAFDAARWRAARLDPGMWSGKAKPRVSVPDADARSAVQRTKLIASLETLPASPILVAPAARAKGDLIIV
jgi:hypothetical protein